MFVIEVIPLIKGTKIDTLSYYSSVNFPIGSILTVPIRGKGKQAIVTDVHPVSDNKTALRSAAFTLKKLPPQEHVSTVPENVRKTAADLTRVYPASIGAILYHLLPPEVKHGTYLYPNISNLTHNEESAPRVLTGRRESRYIAYRSNIRSILARRGSTLCVVPTSVDVFYAHQELGSGIEDRVVVFSPSQTDKERKAAYRAFEDTSLAKLIITTPSHAYLDRVDLLSVILEGEGSEYYRGRERPYIDHRIALITHAKNAGRSIILGDILPQPETEFERREDIYLTALDETKRIVFNTPLNVIEQKEKPTPDTVFSLFSKPLRDSIEHTLAARGRVFLYGARRGIAPVVTCIDCGHIFRCPDSGTPYSLIRTHSPQGNEERWFISTTSGARIRAADTCPGCGSWRLRERGIGIQTVFDECLSLFPNEKVLIFDKETATTRKRAESIMNDFYNTRGVILVGTQMALPYLARRGSTLSAIVSYDATRTSPTWRADEQTLRLLLELRDFSEKEVLVQTRTPIDGLLETAKSGLIENFYSEELSLRSMLLYPPFATFILLSWQGTAEVVKQVETEIQKRTEHLSGTYYSNPLSTPRTTIRHALFRIPKKDPKLAEIITLIKHFPPYVKVEINPSRIV